VRRATGGEHGERGREMALTGLPADLFVAVLSRAPSGSHGALAQTCRSARDALRSPAFRVERVRSGFFESRLVLALGSQDGIMRHDEQFAWLALTLGADGVTALRVLPRVPMPRRGTPPRGGRWAGGACWPRAIGMEPAAPGVVALWRNARIHIVSVARGEVIETILPPAETRWSRFTCVGRVGEEWIACGGQRYIKEVGYTFSTTTLRRVPTGAWAAGPEMPRGSSGGRGIVSRNAFYVLGGQTAEETPTGSLSEGTTMTSLLCYERGVWTERPGLPAPAVTPLMCAVLNDCIHVIASTYDEYEGQEFPATHHCIFDPHLDVWSSLPLPDSIDVEMYPWPDDAHPAALVATENTGLLHLLLYRVDDARRDYLNYRLMQEDDTDYLEIHAYDDASGTWRTPSTHEIPRAAMRLLATDHPDSDSDAAESSGICGGWVFEV